MTFTGVPIAPEFGLNPVMLRAVIVAVVVAVFVPPVVSVTISEIWNVPAEEYVCVVVAPVPVALSPKFHAYDVIVWPVGAAELVPLKLTAWLTFPWYGPPALTVGNPETVAVVEATFVAPLVSVTVRTTGNVPALA